MTLAMELLRRSPDGRARTAFPPRLVAMGVAEKAGIRDYLPEPARQAATLLGHLAYGSSAGSLFPGTTRGLPWPGPVRGVAYGLGIWAASYAGWLPAAGILAPPNRRPLRQNVTLIVAHIIWGLTLGIVSERLSSGRGSDRHGGASRHRPHLTRL